MGKKSPLKDNPLRNPGQSIDDEIKRVIDDDVVPYFLYSFLFIFITVYSWLIWLQIIDIPNPILMTVVTVLVSSYCFYKLIALKKKLKALRLGRDGERAVGQTLDSLKGKGYRVFHDLIGKGFNLDHIIICEHGVFSIETKTYSKPEKGQCKIIYNKEGLEINGYKSGKKIITQAQAQKSWLEKQIVLLAGINVPVKPVVVFPGWYIDNQNKADEVWVLEPKALPAFIENLPKILSEDTVRLVSNYISRYIRTTYDSPL